MEHEEIGDACKEFFAMSLNGYGLDKEKSGMKGWNADQIQNAIRSSRECYFYR